MFLPYYPDFQQILEDAPNLLIAIVRIRKKIEYAATHTQDLKKWDSANDLELAQRSYKKFLELLVQYECAYIDMLSRENSSLISFCAPFFKKLGKPVADANPHISIRFTSRLKSFRSFLEKCITLLENQDWNKLDTFYDIYACKATVFSDTPGDGGDYPNAVQDIYDVLNSFAGIAIEKGAVLMPTFFPKPVSDKVYPEYREAVKDYCFSPKENGYKALHVCVGVKTELGSESVELHEVSKEPSNAYHTCIKEAKGREHVFYFEFQVESMYLAYQNSRGDASHGEHKKRSKIRLDLDYSKIKYPDFFCDYDAEKKLILTIQDYCGLENPKEITKAKLFQKKS